MSRKNKIKKRNIYIRLSIFGLFFILALLSFALLAYTARNQGITTAVYQYGAAVIVLLFGAGLVIAPLISYVEARNKKIAKEKAHEYYSSK